MTVRTETPNLYTARRGVNPRLGRLATALRGVNPRRGLLATARRGANPRRGLLATALGQLAAVLALSLAGCSSSDDGPTTTPPPPADPLASATFDAAGGTLDIPGTSLRLTVPAGALSAETEIVVREAGSPPSGVLGMALDLSPDGATFDVPLELSLAIEVNDLPAGTLPDDIQALARTGSAWAPHPAMTVDVSADGTGSATAYLAHFSSYALVIVPGTDALYGVYGFADDDVTAVGHGSVLAHYDGSAITVADAGLGAATRLFDGWGPDPTDQLIAGWDTVDGRIYASSDGATWTNVAIPPGAGVASTAPLYAIDGDATADVVVAVGRSGRITARRGGAWGDESYLVAGGALTEVRHLRDVEVLSSGECLAVGDELLLVWSGGWTEVDLTTVFGSNRFFLRGVWGRSFSDVTAVGWELDLTRGGLVGVALHFDGATWSRLTTLPPNTPGLRRVWGDADEVVLVGDGGTILRGDGTFFAPEELCETTSETLYDVWAVDDTTAVAVGRNGVLLHPGETCAEEDDGSSSGDGDIVIDFDGDLGDCETGWIEEGVSLDLYPTDPGECGGVMTCNATVSPGRVVLSPGRLRVLFTSASRVEVDIENHGQPVTLEAWYAGAIVDSDHRTGGSGAMTLVVEAPSPDQEPYLVYVAGCSVDVLAIRIFE